MPPGPLPPATLTPFELTVYPNVGTTLLFLVPVDPATTVFLVPPPQADAFAVPGGAS